MASQCRRCINTPPLPFDFTMAFQPIVDCQQGEVFGYEALVRGVNNEPAGAVISQLTDENKYMFDQHCRIKAIALAAKLQIPSMLSINFLPNAIYEPERCIKTTLEAAERYQFPIERIMFEFTEAEKVGDAHHIKRIVEYYRKLGFMTATDDFGAGYSGLNLLADFQTDIVKLDMLMIRNIDQDKTRQIIIRNCVNLLRELGIQVLAEGIETEGEYHWLRAAGINLMQGYLLAKPQFEGLPEVHIPSH
ncbi:EAL domain protein [Pseudoalteromonas sp. SW0106-04]|uniref:EAL domain-containing protein n=1 Tax=Pseudoalteromonas sp. SW0106-04 TaxID=1702169 RepID=UPI0006B4C5B6|nr:EAL domain-containing protein [Pseudoalteromonas sp. SW0106-04]GAP75072.1 EAL domain protein [Pseudoalteromonas sp. SW0106-04]